MTDDANAQIVNTVQILSESSQPVEDVIALDKENSGQDEQSFRDSTFRELNALNGENVQIDETEEDITEIDEKEEDITEIDEQDQTNPRNISTEAEPSWLESARTDLDVYQNNLDAPKLEQILFHAKSIEQIINSLKTDSKQTNKVSGIRKIEEKARKRYNRR